LSAFIPKKNEYSENLIIKMIFFSKKTTANIYSPKAEKIEWLKMKNIQKKIF